MNHLDRNGIGMTSQRTRNRLIERLRTEGIKDEQVLAVMASTPRHLFMDEAMSSRAYEDTALPIGHGQTISQPYIVARMTEALLQGERLARVLEIGTGSGYQTAILAGLVDELYSVERIQELLQQARQRLNTLGIQHVQFAHRDGFEGWAEHAPYDGIMVTAAPPALPRGLQEQLAEGGRLVIPFGQAGEQRLVTITRQGDDYSQQLLDWVSFVPLQEGLI